MRWQHPTNDKLLELFSGCGKVRFYPAGNYSFVLYKIVDGKEIGYFFRSEFDSSQIKKLRKRTHV